MEGLKNVYNLMKMTNLHQSEERKKVQTFELTWDMLKHEEKQDAEAKKIE